MASANTSWSEDNFSCSICLDVFNSPVSTPCGHNFCRTCITKFWDDQVQYKCPVCNELFHTRPDLRVNTLLSQMVDQFRRSVRVKELPCVEPGEVPCDVCTGTQLKAVKSCLMCFTSYCHTHLEPHQRVAGLKRHLLVEPMDRLEDRMCKKHDRLLELFCQTDQVCVCQFCIEADHRSHPVVPLKEEYEVKTAQLGKIESEVQQMIQERQRKIKEINDTVDRSKADADIQIADGEQVLAALMSSIEKQRDDFNQTVKEKLKSTEKQAEGLIKELEQEIEDLTNIRSEVKQLTHTEDHLHFLQTFTSLKNPPHTRDWTKVEVRPPPYIGSLRRSLDQLEETLNMERKKLCDDAELKRVQQYEVDVTLDPDTAHPDLNLSEDGKQVHDGGVRKELPDNRKRFTKYTYVLTRQSFSSGRFYFEVQVKNKTAWRLGVARQSIGRKGDLIATPLKGYWSIFFTKDHFLFKDNPDVLLPLRAELQKVGVFVDYDEGLVSFYDVEARIHIYSATGCTFREPLYPFLCPGLHNYKGMASANTSWSEDNFSCSICLDVFNSPVSTPCGHNFCRSCITKFWDDQVQYKCPICNELFHTRPDLRVNTFISEMVDQFRRSVRVKELPCVEPGEVPCDVCTGTQLKAVKSCLMCFISYCHTHLEPHQRVAGLKKHLLVEPMDRLEDRLCKKHNQLLELFCQTDQVCVCQFCTEADHKSHPVVPLKEEYIVKTAQLAKIESEVQQMVQERQRKIKEIKEKVDRSKADADRQIADGVQVLAALMSSIEKWRDDFNKTVKDKLKSTEKQAEGLIKELEQEIEDLTNIRSEVKQLSHTEDHLHFLQTFTSMKNPPHTRDWTTVEVRPPPYIGSLRRSLDQLEETLNMERKKLCNDAELKRVQQYEVDVTLDPDTAQTKLILSEDGKQVHDGGVEKNLPDNRKRFTKYTYVLTRQSFSSGRFYFEVQVKKKTVWRLGVARESIDRKGDLIATPGNGYWNIFFNKDKLVCNDNPDVRLPLRAELQKVGVFIDYDEGLVSYYDVEARVHIYSATGCTFRNYNFEGINSAPLIISPVNQTERREERGRREDDVMFRKRKLVFTGTKATRRGGEKENAFWDKEIVWQTETTTR
ncbi:E3 ubiquitin-protein ligase TRIM39 [Merluccius polli]|uniref:E3 ubiquitin-protein ligase TRIM39 n=1 Tax=Merluccius polli TaxID=89951 RepID=A0AA47NUR2_MERPO|nr:E3 ubiquitin-protein ligase TRIM39 [Merluccius polli]